MILSDECYSEIYTRDAPGSVLECAGPDFTNVVAFQSLSKRSNLPGMRVGFAAGDKKFLGRFHELRNVAAPQVPVPLQHVAVAAYSDEAHVEENRRLYRIKFDLADQILGSRYGYARPAGGFCVWLDVSDRGGDEAATVKLYRDAGVRVVPGSYLARPQADGSNPGAGYIRLALVSDSETTAEALHRLVETLELIAGPHEHASDRTCHSPGRPLAGVDPRGAGAAPARTRRPCLIALSGVAAAALMTWSVQDPSLSHATSRAIRNILGYPGAIGADLLMQIFGLGAIMLILPVAVWGWRMLTHRTFDREALRIACWILCTVIAAGFASCWAHGGAWPLPTGLGGVSAMRWSARRRSCSDRPVSLSPRARRHSLRGMVATFLLPAAWARVRRRRN